VEKEEFTASSLFGLVSSCKVVWVSDDDWFIGCLGKFDEIFKGKKLGVVEPSGGCCSAYRFGFVSGHLALLKVKVVKGNFN